MFQTHCDEKMIIFNGLISSYNKTNLIH